MKSRRDRLAEALTTRSVALSDGQQAQRASEENRMTTLIDASRRQLLKKVGLGIALAPIATISAPIASAADLALVTADDPAAKA